VTLLEDEAARAALQGDPPPRHDDTGAEAVEVGLDESDHLPVRRRDAEQHRAAAGRPTGTERPGPWPDERPPAGEVCRVEEPGRRHLDPGRVPDVGERVGERDPHRLDLQVEGGGVGEVGAELEAVEDAERHQGRDPLPVRRDLGHPVSAVCGGHRLDPLALVGGQVPGRQESVRPGGELGDGAGDLTGVEVLRTGLGEPVQGAGVPEETDPVTRTGSAAVRGERGPEGGALGLRQPARGCDAPLPVVRDDRGDGGSLRREIRGRLEEPLPREPTEAPVQVAPGPDLSRHRDRAPSGERHPGAATGAYRLSGERGGSPAGAVVAVQPGAVPHQGERITPEAVRRRLHHGQRGGGRDGGIDRGTSRAQDRAPHLGRRRMARRDHPVPGANGRPGLGQESDHPSR
jgi:hypothetical protein